MKKPRPLSHVPRLSLRLKAYAITIPLLVVSGVMVASAFVPLENTRTRVDSTTADIEETFAASTFAQKRLERVFQMNAYVVTGRLQHLERSEAAGRESASALDDWLALEDTPSQRAEVAALKDRITAAAPEVNEIISLVQAGRPKQAEAALLSLYASAFDPISFELGRMLQFKEQELRAALVDLAGNAGAASGLLGSELSAQVSATHREIEQSISGSTVLQLETMRAAMLGRALGQPHPFADGVRLLGTLASGELTNWQALCKMSATHTPITQKRISGLATLDQRVTEVTGTILADIEAGDLTSARRSYADQFIDRAEGLFVRANWAIAQHENAVRSSVAHIVDDGRNAQIWALIVACALFAIAVAVVLLVRRVSKRTAILDATAQRFAEGDLDARVAGDHADELGRLGTTLNVMADRLTRERERAGQLLDRMVQSAEAERMQLAAELHDGPVQRLTGVLYGLERTGSRLDRGESEGVKDLIGDAKAKVAAEVRSLRHLMSELRPPALDQRGFAAAINDYVSDFASKSCLSAVVDVSMEERLPSALETTMYRVVQEALTNVQKHAQAQQIAVKASAEDGSIVLRVTDDGVGCDASTRRDSENTDHYGLTAMLERTQLAGGEFRFESEPGSGTTIVATFPRVRRAAA